MFIPNIIFPLKWPNFFSETYPSLMFQSWDYPISLVRMLIAIIAFRLTAILDFFWRLVTNFHRRPWDNNSKFESFSTTRLNEGKHLYLLIISKR